MPKLIRYRNGLRLKGVKCSWCNRQRNATVFTSRIRWSLRLSCGHVKIPGYILPPDVLIEEGFANYNSRAPDYRYEQLNAHEEWERQAKLEKQEKELKELTKRGLLHGVSGMARRDDWNKVYRVKK